MRRPLPWQGLAPRVLALATLAVASPARGEVLRWELSLGPGQLGRVEVLRPTEEGGEERLLRLLTADGEGRGRLGWRPDEDPAAGAVAGRIELALPPGLYLVREADDRGERRRALGVRGGARATAVPLPPGASGALGWREGDGGHDGFAWAPAAEGRAALPLPAGRWRIVPAGAGGWIPEDVVVAPDRPASAPVFRPLAPVDRRLPDQRWAVRLLLLPLTGALLLAGLAGLRLARPDRRAAALALAVAAAAAAAAAWPVLLDPAGRILDAGPPIEDPAGSTGLLATLTAALADLTDRAPAFAFPEGSSWLTVGPTWLGFLPAAAVAALAGPVAGHNLGVALGLLLLALCSQALARDLGARPAAAALAGVATALGPAVLDEVDAWTLDRSTLWLVPLALLALGRAARLPGLRWPLLAGCALAATFYGQVYYGLYLLVLAPWLAALRLPGPGWRPRLGRLLLAGLVALVLLAPGLWLLRAGTSASPYAEQGAAAAAWSEDEVAGFLAAHDPTLGGTAGDRGLPMTTAEERRLSAAALGLTLAEALRPADLLPGRALYWPLALLAVALARPGRRAAAAIALADVALLVLHAMGPALRVEPTRLGPPLPYALELALIPGFDQLKNSYRFGTLAAALAAVPLALGLDGLLARLPAAASRWLGLPLAVGGGLLLAGLRLPPIEPALGSQPAARPVAAWELRWPRTRLLPAAAPLDELGPGAIFALPLRHPTPPDVVLTATARGLPLANPPPFDSGEGSALAGGRSLPLLVEEDPLLNRLAWASGSDRAGVWLELDPATAAASRQRLAAWGLRHVVLYRELVPPALLPETEATLDRWLTRVADDGAVAAWSLAPAASPAQ